VSAYALTIEPATPLGRKVQAGMVPGPDPDLQADMFNLACEKLRDAGYGHYEVSNWASAPEFECRHNLGYWRKQPYLGLGAGAHSYRDGRRWWNVRPPGEYLEAVEQGLRPVAGEEHLTLQDERLEEVFLKLRILEGVPVTSVAGDVASRFMEQGLLRRRNSHLVPTERGMLLLNELVLALTG
jgi:oxygen-independent coproporphyrinogen-3 oxidase